ncbi:hypothetical protein P775_06940 [Puniceibacterium antarcticum]|uniref:Phasin domain-containing protein n=1 Tax=Puniceibacterium antarcticum TaxID=1206336 RepID=A0A2G8RH41_9RHOB|nr:phasin family protein [Puniceibacterium antarcticum]PIL20894.1 hypothetical protein P775_06940 [Puniceibacterium antarcticum]
MEKSSVDGKNPQTHPAASGDAYSFVSSAPTLAAWSELLTLGNKTMADAIQQVMEAQKALFACRTAQDVMVLQSQFMRNAIEQYMSQAKRLTEKTSATTKQTLGAQEIGHKRKFDDVPL